MKWELIKRASAETIRSIRAMDFQNMEISEYNRSYINRIILHLEYHFKIYENAIMLLLQKKENTKSYFVDFGGGHGFLSLLLKKIGLNVIYCDFNPLSVKTIKLIKETAGYGPDIILEGSSPELLSFCRKSKILPDYLISIDLIEHVYDLDAFFADLHLLNPKMQMLFTTGSNPSNFYKSKKLRKIMIRAEKEDYFHLRKNFIIENFPEISQTDADILAKKTRGLIFPEIKKNIEQ
jgi:2-polyprenyl-3-methyl-5-hydroxy-6-metoxy-1,4-benzoquinol methylase